MTDRRIIFIGKKPLHAYVRAVVKAMEDGDREVQLVARGAAVLGGVGLVVLIGAGVVLALMRRDGGEGGDRFGMQ